MAESKLTQDLAELAEQCRDLLSPPPPDTEPVRRLLILPDATEDNSWSPINGAFETPDAKVVDVADGVVDRDLGANTSSKIGSEESWSFDKSWWGDDEFKKEWSCSFLLLLVAAFSLEVVGVDSGAPHNWFISSKTRMKSSSTVTDVPGDGDEAIESATWNL